MTERQENIHQARVYLGQARSTKHRQWRATLLGWAAKRREMAAQCQRMEQGDMFQ